MMKRKIFFLQFSEEFLNSKGENLAAALNENIKKYSCLINKFPNFDEDKESFLKLADELMLFCLCGINVRYTEHTFESYKKGLWAADKTLEYIKVISQQKEEFFVETPKKKSKSWGVGLKGLTCYFKGRFYFGLGEFNKAEAEFKKSSSMYLEKMNQLISSTTDEDAKTRTLSMRRAILAEVIGLTNLYLVQSRIDEALRILHRVRPLLEFGTGKLMIAYCNLLNVSVNRAKYSSNVEKLNELKAEAERSFEIFEELVGNKHFSHRANIELALINFYLAKHFSGNQIQKRERYYHICLDKLNEAIAYAKQPTAQKEYKNRRILIEALTIRSHIYRNYADLDKTHFQEQIDKALADSLLAQEIAKGLSQLESDALIATGIVFRDMYAEAAEVNLRFSHKQAHKDQAQIFEFLKKSRAYFFEALNLNVDNNARITAICYLRLTELEMLNQTNYARAKYFFEKFKNIESQVSHQYVLEFAQELEKILQQRKNFEFFVDPVESLQLKFWKDKLENFLVEQTMFYSAQEIGGQLPEKRERSKEPYKKQNNRKTAPNRHTRRSILQKHLLKKWASLRIKPIKWRKPT